MFCVNDPIVQLVILMYNHRTVKSKMENHRAIQENTYVSSTCVLSAAVV